VRSTIETFGVGTRMEVPFSLPFSSGITSPIIFAAPVEEGIMLIAAARSAPQVLVRQVEDALVVGVAVDGGHQATLDAEALHQHIGPPAPGNWWCSWRWR